MSLRSTPKQTVDNMSPSVGGGSEGSSRNSRGLPNTLGSGNRGWRPSLTLPNPFIKRAGSGSFVREVQRYLQGVIGVTPILPSSYVGQRLRSFVRLASQVLKESEIRAWERWMVINLLRSTFRVCYYGVPEQGFRDFHVITSAVLATYSLRGNAYGRLGYNLFKANQAVLIRKLAEARRANEQPKQQHRGGRKRLPVFNSITRAVTARRKVGPVLRSLWVPTQAPATTVEVAETVLPVQYSCPPIIGTPLIERVVLPDYFALRGPCDHQAVACRHGKDNKALVAYPLWKWVLRVAFRVVRGDKKRGIDGNTSVFPSTDDQEIYDYLLDSGEDPESEFPQRWPGIPEALRKTYRDF